MFKYNNTSIYISTGDYLSNQLVSGSIKELSRVQSISIGLNLPKVNIQGTNLYGKSIQLEKPTVDVNLEYYLSNGGNEVLFGFETGDVSAIRGLNKEKNLYSLFVKNGLEANSYNGNDPSAYQTLSIGNILLNNYAINAQIGNGVQVSCGFQALNLLSQTGVPSGQQLPSVDPQNYYSTSGNYNLPLGYQQNNSSIKLVSSKDISMSLPTGLAFALATSGANQIILQGFNFNFQINRNLIKEIGSIISERKTIFPIEFTISTQAVVDQFKQDKLNSLICSDDDHNFNIIMKESCSENKVLDLYFNKVKLESQIISQSFPGQTQVDLQWKGTMFNYGTGDSYFSIKKYL